MSEPVTNVEIEDVLSSIRRLVSEDARVPLSRTSKPDAVGPKAVQTRPDPGAAQTAAPAEALILTPALRVAEAQDEPSEEGESAQDSDHSEASRRDEVVADQALHEASHEAQTEAQAVEAEHSDAVEADRWPSTEGRDGAQDNDILILSDIPEARVPEDEGADALEAHEHTAESHDPAPEQNALEIADQEDDPEADAQDFGPHGANTAERPSDADVSLEDEAHSDYDAQAEAEQEPVHYFDGQFEDITDVAQDAHEVTFSSEQPFDSGAALPQDMMPDADARDEPQSIEDKISALEALIARTDQDFEPDGAEMTPAASISQAMPWQNDVPPAVEDMPDPDAPSQTAQFDADTLAFKAAHAAATQEVADEIATVAETTLSSVTQPEAALLDEEALRDMVADIVRQELQGSLGERITRNVRKLVRREIYRALAANELD